MIDYADFIIKNNDGDEIERGIPTIEGHKIITLFSAVNKGKFYCEFIYRIGPEILKANIYVEVI